ncbi:MAG: hypothetical protein A2Z31_07400 [candidate division NC10 bacterium RBG_16_65_8]|nr:MAG: hypothetical protein A2Z31_07400 [candidate division NC10 bacterium RBG_16_65_8]
MIQSELAQSLALAIDLAALRGSGSTTHQRLDIATLTKGGSSDCSEVHVGNSVGGLLAMRDGLEFLGSTVAGDSSGRASSTDQLSLHAIQREHIGLQHVQSVCLCSDARADNA